jgi:nucleotidyltransferase substrate binding protein (TIGR01987 family)
MDPDIRWKQRFQNFEKSYQILASILEKKELTLIDQLALIKIFELSFELFWNTLKDYLQAQEVEVKFPREVIKESVHFGLLEPTEIWLEMLENRNLMAHAYDNKKSLQAILLIKEEYANSLQNFYVTFLEKLKTE